MQKHNLDIVIIGTTFTGVQDVFLSREAIVQIPKNKGKKVRVLNPPYAIYLLSRLYFSLLYFFKIRAIHKKSIIKLIHAQDTGHSGFPAVIAGKIMNIPVVVSSHGIRHKSLQPILTGRLGKILLKFEYALDIFSIKHADGVIAVNPEIQKYYEKLIDKKIEYIPNPVKMKDFVFSSTDRNLFRKELGMEKQIVLVGYVGRLSPEKNLITLINSFAKAIRSNPNLRLVIVGTGSQESQLKEEVVKNYLEDKVIFCGQREDIVKILSGLDIFVLPSYHEGLSSALLEAMSCERAIICSNIPGNHALITHSKEGLLVNPDNAEEITDAIRLLSIDDCLRTTLGNNAKNKVMDYDEDIVFPKILHYYSTLIQKK